MNKVIQVISSRVSCRSYSDKKVPKGKLSQILEAGKFAPSGMNKQVCNILVIKSKSLLEKIRLALKEKFNRDCLYGAPHLCLVKGNENEPLLVQDASCILENMFVAATALKVDSCCTRLSAGRLSWGLWTRRRWFRRRHCPLCRRG